MQAPNTPCFAPSRSQKRSYSGSAALAGGGFAVAGPVAPASVAVEGELADAERLALVQRLVHPPLGVVEDAQRPHLVGEPVGLRLAVLAPDAKQHEHPGPICATRSPSTSTAAWLTRALALAPRPR